MTQRVTPECRIVEWRLNASFFLFVHNDCVKTNKFLSFGIVNIPNNVTALTAIQTNTLSLKIIAYHKGHSKYQ